MLLGVSEIELNLKSQTVVIDDLCVREFQIAGEQVDISKSASPEIRLCNDDYIEWLGKISMQHLSLIDASFNIAFCGLLNQVLLVDVAIIDFLAIFCEAHCSFAVHHRRNTKLSHSAV